jgi:hypothetical protein
VIFHPIHKTTSQTLSRPSKFLSSGCTTIITTGNPGFAEGQKLSAKATKHPAKSLPRVALGKGPTGIFFLGHDSLPSTRAQGSRHSLCREPIVGHRPKNSRYRGFNLKVFEILFAYGLTVGSSTKRGFFYIV